MIDLHTHSTCSDGQYKPERLAQLAAEAGIKVMALTDHDTINGLERAANAAKKFNIDFIPGIEIGSQGGRELHILGYGIDPCDKGLRDFYEGNRIHRLARRDRFIELLNKSGVPITLEEICRVNDGKSTGRPHIARTLVEMGYAESVNDAFSKYLQTPEFYSMDRPKPMAADSIAMIRNAGGIAVLAHPYTLHIDDEPFRKLVKSLISAGLCGIECFYSRHTTEQTKYYMGIAIEYGLIYTCGSDYHGPCIKPDIVLGKGVNGSLINANVPEDKIIEMLKDKMQERFIQA